MHILLLQRAKTNHLVFDPLTSTLGPSILNALAQALYGDQLTSLLVVCLGKAAGSLSGCLHLLVVKQAAV